MTTFSATPLQFDAPPAAISTFLSNMSNLRQIMPEQVEQWQSDENSCSFFIKNLGHLSMQTGDFYFPRQFNFTSTESSKVKFILSFNYRPGKVDTPTGFFEVTADINPMIEMLAKRPLTNFVNLLTENFSKKLL